MTAARGAMEVVRVAQGDPGWDRFVLAARGASSYHRMTWGSVITRSFGHACHYLAAVDADGPWAGVLPLVHVRSFAFGSFLVSLPFVNYGGVLATRPEAVPALLAEAEALRRRLGATHVELRHVEPIDPTLPTRRVKVSMVLDLRRDPDAQWSAFDPKVRNQIRKATKSGLSVKVAGIDALDDFYGVFARNMRDLGTPVYPLAFFRHVLEAFPAETSVILVRQESETVAAGILHAFGDTVEVPWASSVAQSRPLCPNHLLYWQAIRTAIERGATSFDFGRSTPGAGTYNFKKQWGAEPVPLAWQYLTAPRGHAPDLSPGNPRFGTAIRVWRRLPLAVANRIGPLIVRGIP